MVAQESRRETFRHSLRSTTLPARFTGCRIPKTGRLLHVMNTRAASMRIIWHPLMRKYRFALNLPERTRVFGSTDGLVTSTGTGSACHSQERRTGGVLRQGCLSREKACIEMQGVTSHLRSFVPKIPSNLFIHRIFISHSFYSSDLLQMSQRR